jgi:predicted amidohydrolase YtcJ
LRRDYAYGRLPGAAGIFPAAPEGHKVGKGSNTVQHDLALVGGRVITLDGARVAQAVGVRAGHIAAVGDDAEVGRGCGPATRVIDLGGRVVAPGLFDAHAHMDREGLKLRGGASLQGRDSVAGVVQAVREAAARTPKGEWIVMMPLELAPEGGMRRFVSSPEHLRDGRWPSRHDLDQAAPDHPVVIREPWGWWSRPPSPAIVNSRALAAAGIGRDTPAPHNCEIVKDATGEPTGVLLDRNRSSVLEHTLLAAMPRFTYEDRLSAAEWGARLYNMAGTTAVYEGHGLTPALIDAYGRVHAKGALTARVQAPLSLPTAAVPDREVGDLLYQWADRLAGTGAGDRMLRTDGICLDMGDPGVARAIARAYPYEQWAGFFYQALTRERFIEIGTLAARLGIRVNAIASGQIESVLSAYEAIDRAVAIRDRRWVLMHLTEATDDQLRRIKALGIVLTITPGLMWEATTRFQLDKKGAEGTPIRRCLDAGIPVALASDNVPIRMFWVMWQALARVDNDTKVRLGPSNLTREEALRMTCETGHLLSWSETTRGRIALGHDADLIVIDRDPLACAEDEIRDIEVLRTFVAGREVYAADSTPAAKP